MTEARLTGPSKYCVLFELGQGGTANVSLAVSRGPSGFQKLFVLKTLRASYALDPEFRAMFMNEARISARLNHPNVVQVYDVYEESGLPTIAMEYIQGQTLETIVTRSPSAVPLAIQLRILRDVLSGLHYSHELAELNGQPLEIVHRDVSPHNVLVSYEGFAKLVDFGIAKLAGSTVETEAGVIKGKLRYMPPEQIAGNDVDRRADLYAVGVMLWEALSGTRLWKGLSDASIMNRVLSGDIPPPRREDGNVPPELEAICMRALAADREERFGSALEFETALEQFCALSGEHATPRDVARFLSASFEGERRRVVSRIEEELAREDGRITASLAQSRTPARDRTPPPLAGRIEPDADTHAQRSRLWAGALLLLVAGVVAIAFARRPTHTAQNDEPAAPHDKPTAHAAGSASTATPLTPPSEADRDTPSPTSTPPASSESRTAGRSPAHVPAERLTRRIAEPANSSAHPPPAELDPCLPPYYLDARGIKKFKTQCL